MSTIDENNRKHALFIRTRLIQISDEPCSTCGRPAGDLRVLESLAHVMGKTTPPATAICEPCFREQNGMQRKTEEARMSDLRYPTCGGALTVDVRCEPCSEASRTDRLRRSEEVSRTWSAPADPAAEFVADIRQAMGRAPDPCRSCNTNPPGAARPDWRRDEKCRACGATGTGS